MGVRGGGHSLELKLHDHLDDLKSRDAEIMPLQVGASGAHQLSLRGVWYQTASHYGRGRGGNNAAPGG